MEIMSRVHNKSNRKIPETPVEITEEMKELLAGFSEEEIETGVVKTGRSPAGGSHTIQDLKDAFQSALLEETIGGMLRAVREQHDHSLGDTAQSLGISRARVHQLEHPEANLRIDTLQRFACAYGYKVQVTLVPKDATKRAVSVELPG